MASRWTGQSIREGNMATSSVKPSTPGAAYGKGAMLSPGYFAYVSGKAGSRVTVRMMRTRTHEAGTQTHAPQQTVLLRRLSPQSA
jgi:hypothetical protein